MANVPKEQIHPDIWINNEDGINKIYVTPEWLRQPKFEKQKRIVHEILHILGEEHWSRPISISSKTINTNILYSTYPDYDTFSLLVWYNLHQRIK